MDDESKKSGDNKDIPIGYKLAGIRFRSSEVITKDDCIYMLKDMTSELTHAGGQAVSDELDRADVIEEELKGGKLKAFNLLVKTTTAEKYGIK